MDERRIKDLAAPRAWDRRERNRAIVAAGHDRVGQLRSIARDSRHIAGLGARLALRVALTLGLAILAAYLTQVVPSWLTRDLAPIPSIGWIADVGRWLGAGPPASGIGFQPVLTAALGVCGSLAGVYFATVAFVVSNTYKDATIRIRRLVVRLPVARLYGLVYLAAVLFALSALGISFLGKTPTRLTMCVTAALGAFIVLSFSRLRTELYDLLEPVNLFAIVQQDIDEGLADASSLPAKPSAEPRATACRKRLQESLLTLDDLCRLVLARDQSTPSTDTSRGTVDHRINRAALIVATGWAQYANMKPPLTGLPGWNPEAVTFRDGLLLEQTSLTLALQTHTMAMPEKGHDPMWVERQLSHMLGRLLAGRDAAVIGGVVAGLPDLTSFLTTRGQFAESRMWIDTIARPIRSALELVHRSDATESDRPNGAPGPDEPTAQAKPDPSDDFPRTPHRPAATDAAMAEAYWLVDTVGSGHVASARGMFAYLTRLTTDLPGWTVREVREVRDAGGGSALGPGPAQAAAQLRDSLAFEQEVEGHTVTSDANIRQYMAMAVATEAIDETARLLSTFEVDFVPWSLGIAELGNPAAGAALSRIDEALHALAQPIAVLQILYKQCTDARVDVDDRWPDLDIDTLHERLRLLCKLIPSAIATFSATATPDRSQGLPDTFGWAFHRTSEELLRDALNPATPGDSHVDTRAGHLFQATQRAVARISEDVQRNHPMVTTSFATEPYKLLMQTSGIATVIAALTGDRTVADTFDGHWAKLIQARPQHLLNVMTLTLNSDEGLFGFTSGGVFRTSRSQRAEQRIREFIPGWETYGHGASRLQDVPAEAARLLRHWMGDDFAQLYYASYLVPQAKTHGADVTVQVSPHVTDLIAHFEQDTP